MNLFVDDIRSPLDSTWVTARSVTEAIRMLSRIDFDTVSLDHDIDDELSKVENFEPVARYIAAKQWKLAPLVILHSGNPVGAQTMRNILEDAGIKVRVQPRV